MNFTRHEILSVKLLATIAQPHTLFNYLIELGVVWPLVMALCKYSKRTTEVSLEEWSILPCPASPFPAHMHSSSSAHANKEVQPLVEANGGTVGVRKQWLGYYTIITGTEIALILKRVVEFNVMNIVRYFDIKCGSHVCRNGQWSWQTWWHMKLTTFSICWIRTAVQILGR